MYRLFLSLFSIIFVLGIATAQKQSEVVQFSGSVVSIEDEEIVPVPLTNILIEKSGRGTFADLDGFFSIVAEEGDVIVFSAIGYETVRFVIPDTLTTNRYTIIQLMSRDTINLPMAQIFPWPSREHFKIEFLALDVPEDLQDRAEANLAAATMEQLRKNLPADGVESGSFYLRQQADSYYSFGQARPLNLLNPIAWSKFFKAWKNGDFRRKKTKE
jgi:hypothetical protein